MNRNRPFISGVTSDVLNREKNLLVTANTLGKIFSGKTESNLQFNNMINAGLFRFNDTSAGGPIEVTSGYLLVQTVNPDYNSAQEVKIRQLVYDDGSNDLYTRVGTAVRVGYSITWTPWTRIGGSDLYNRYVILHEDTYGSAGYYYRAFNSYVLTLPEPDDCAEGDHICLEQNESLGIVIHLRMADFPTNCPATRRYMYDPNSQLLFHAEEISIRGNTRYRWDLVEEDQTFLYNEYKNNSQFYVGNGYWSKAKIEYLQPEIIVNEKSSKRFVAYIAKNVELEKYWLIEADNDTSTMVKSLIAFITETNNTSKRLILRTKSELIAADAEDRAYADAQDLVYDEINKERFKKIFKGINQNGVDFNTLVTGQFLRFDETSSNGPVDVKSGYALIFSINYEESEETGLRVRQIVYSDDNPGIYTREGTADTQFVMPTWSEWTLYGDTRSFSLHTRLTDSIVGVPGTYYRSSETCVITLPPAYRFPVGSSIGLEQSVNVGIVIDNNDDPTTSVGSKMFDPISNILFEYQSDNKWETIEDVTDPVIVAQYRANANYSIRNRKIEYVAPYTVNSEEMPRRFIARVTENAAGSKYWAIDADEDCSDAIKGLVEHINEKYQDLISYVNKHGSRYSYFRNLTVDGLVGRTLTLYKSAQPAVLTLPTISEEKEGRWIGLMQFTNKGYVVNSESVSSSVNQKIWDNHVNALFQQTTSNKLWRIIDPLDADFPSDIVDNHDGTYTVPSSYLNANFKVIEVDATSDVARIEFTVAVKPDNSRCWVTEGSKPLITF